MDFPPEGVIYCGRGRGGSVPLTPGEYGWLGNPIVIRKPCPQCGTIHTELGSTLSCYEAYLIGRLLDDSWASEFYKLDPSNLWCFCKDKAKCHTSVMAKYLKKEIKQMFENTKDALLSNKISKLPKTITRLMLEFVLPDLELEINKLWQAIQGGDHSITQPSTEPPAEVGLAPAKTPEPEEPLAGILDALKESLDSESSETVQVVEKEQEEAPVVGNDFAKYARQVIEAFKEQILGFKDHTGVPRDEPLSEKAMVVVSQILGGYTLSNNLLAIPPLKDKPIPDSWVLRAKSIMLDAWKTEEGVMVINLDSDVPAF